MAIQTRSKPLAKDIPAQYTDAMKHLIIATKTFMPPPRPDAVLRPRLAALLNEGRQRQLTLVSAPAGFGKTSLVSQWITSCGWPAAWLSLDPGDNDPARFLAYLIAALREVPVQMDDTLSELPGSPQTTSPEYILTLLLNQVAAGQEHFFLVLDDLHVITSAIVNAALSFLLDNLPPRLHLVILTREDPSLPLARLRARGQLAELRAADLRFSFSEAAEFLGRVMGLRLTEGEIAELESRTEGWITGLQLAAISMCGQADTTEFIRAFTGSNRFILDYLVEEVLERQPGNVKSFLLRTSVLDRMCGPLCDAVIRDSATSGQETLEALERSNLFIIPLDADRRWFRYHHLFADLLRQRLARDPSSGGRGGTAEFHIRASQWYEDNDLPLEAFRHAVAANDVERAERLMERKSRSFHLSGAAEILAWLSSLPVAVLDTRPLLRVRSATLLLSTGQTTGVEDRLRAAEVALAALPRSAGTDSSIRDLIGQIAAARGTLAFTRYQPDEMAAQSRRALEYLAPGNMPFHFTANWTLGMAYLFRGERAEAGAVIAGALSHAKESKNVFNTILALTSTGQLQLLNNRLDLAEVTYKEILRLIGDRPHQVACEAYRGLACIYYEWNDLDAAERYGHLSLERARMYDRAIDRFVLSEVLLARVKLARRDIQGADAMLEETGRIVRRDNFSHRIPDVASVQVDVLLHQKHPEAAALYAQKHFLPVSRAKVFLFEGNATAALALLEPLHDDFVRKGWLDEDLKVLVLQAVSHHMLGDKSKAAGLLDQALHMAEPGGFIRLFVDEGAQASGLLADAAARSALPDYASRLLAAFVRESSADKGMTGPAVGQPRLSAMDPLSPRELEVLRLIARGFSNQEICRSLYLALDTVKGHNRRIFEKLQVQRRTEAVARARLQGLI
jgi:LuxR family transcriptional regulator, maltose regulon positive regulatory protein